MEKKSSFTNEIEENQQESKTKLICELEKEKKGHRMERKILVIVCCLLFLLISFLIPYAVRKNKIGRNRFAVTAFGWLLSFCSHP